VRLLLQLQSRHHSGSSRHSNAWSKSDVICPPSPFASAASLGCGPFSVTAFGPSLLGRLRDCFGPRRVILRCMTSRHSELRALEFKGPARAPAKSSTNLGPIETGAIAEKHNQPDSPLLTRLSWGQGLPKRAISPWRLHELPETLGALTIARKFPLR
jgi:hypothetical protein